MWKVSWILWIGILLRTLSPAQFVATGTSTSGSYCLHISIIIAFVNQSKSSRLEVKLPGQRVKIQRLLALVTSLDFAKLFPSSIPTTDISKSSFCPIYYILLLWDDKIWKMAIWPWRNRPKVGILSRHALNKHFSKWKVYKVIILLVTL